MSENEKVLSYLETKKLVKRFGNVTTLDKAITENKTGIIMLYRHNGIKVIIKRYRTERFVGILEGV